MRIRFAMLAGGALLTTGLGFAAAFAGSVEPSASPEQRPAASAPQQAAAISMVVYKSQT
jgi:hypothetical protein